MLQMSPANQIPSDGVKKMLAKIKKNISSLTNATMFKMIATAAILIPLPIVAFVMHRGGFAQQLRALSASLEVTRVGDAPVEIKLQELCSALDWVKRELIKVPSHKIQHDKSQFSWNGLLFEPSFRLFCDCLSHPEGDKHQSISTKILVQVDTICHEFTEPRDLFFDADLGYLAHAWKVKMHQALQANAKNRLEELFNRSIIKKPLPVAPVSVVEKKISRASGATAPTANGTGGTKSGSMPDEKRSDNAQTNQDYRADTDELASGQGQRNASHQKTDESESDDSDRPSSVKSSDDTSDLMDEIRSLLGKENDTTHNFSDVFAGKDAQWVDQMNFEKNERLKEYELIRDCAMENHRQDSFKVIKKKTIARFAASSS